MADLGGLLNIFGSVPSYASGLLSEEELDAAKGRARANALLQMGQSFYKAGAPRETPGGSTLSGVAGALLSGQQAYQGAVKGSIEEKLNNQKIQDALNAKKRQTEIQGLISGAYQPAQAAQQPAMIGGAPYGMETPATPARFDLQAIAPQLMQTAEGRAAWGDLMNAQKAMRPDLTTLKEGEELGYYQDGQWTSVASRAPKQTKIDLSSSFADAVDRLGLVRKNANQYTEQELALINAKAKEIDKAKKAETTIKPPSDLQILAGGFADRMTAAQSLTSALESQAPVGVMESIYKAIPLIGKEIPQILPKSFGGLSPERRQYLQAANNWIRANLRKESGAAIGADEWTEEYVNYFPQPGDDDDTIKQKAMFREITTQNMARSAGREYTPSVPTSIAKKKEDLYSQYGLTPRGSR
jgi:hypothetical protein